MAYKVNLHGPDGCCVDYSDSGDGGVLGSEKINDFRVSAFFFAFWAISSAATGLVVQRAEAEAASTQAERPFGTFFRSCCECLFFAFR